MISSIAINFIWDEIDHVLNHRECKMGVLVMNAHFEPLPISQEVQTYLKSIIM